jgi:hypothetical protein
VAEVPENPGSLPPEPASAAIPPFQPVAPAYQPVSAPGQTFPTLTPPPPPLKKGGTSALKIILIILGIFVFLILLVVSVIGYGVWRVSKSVHVNKDTGAITMPGMSMNDPGLKLTAQDLGTEIYPGAIQAKTGSMRMKFGGTSSLTGIFHTSDSQAQVVAFYKDKLGSGATAMEFGPVAILTRVGGNHDSVTVTVSQKASEDGSTQIQIQHTVKN